MDTSSLKVSDMQVKYVLQNWSSVWILSHALMVWCLLITGRDVPLVNKVHN